MNITIFGTGYVGLVTGTCLAEVGHQVVCLDIDEKKLERIRSGHLPIFERGLEPLVAENLRLGTLNLTSDLIAGINQSELLMIAVGTPPDEDGSADLIHVLNVAGSIGQHMQNDKTVLIKSTVPVGTASRVNKAIGDRLQERNVKLRARVASNPEFLKEGSAVGDFMKPDRIIVGTDSKKVRKLTEELYAPFNRSSDRMLFMDIRSAELTKYAANAILATKISYINEVANLAEKLGADIEHVRKGIGSDPRIGYQFIYPGCGYGGSCFPKDVRALINTAKHFGCDMRVLEAVESVNNHQKTRLFQFIQRHYGNQVAGKTFAVWGLAFKPNTDDMREASSRVLLEALWDAGARVQAYDPEAMDEAERIYGQREDFTLLGTRDAAVKNADALVICTEWPHFRAPDFAALSNQLRDRVIFDGRNLYEPTHLEAHSLDYYGIGRGQSIDNDVML